MKKCFSIKIFTENAVIQVLAGIGADFCNYYFVNETVRLCSSDMTLNL